MSFGVIVYLSSIHAGLFTPITLLIVIFTVTKPRVLYPLPRDSGVSIASRLKASAAADTHRMCHLGACFMLVLQFGRHSVFLGTANLLSKVTVSVYDTAIRRFLFDAIKIVNFCQSPSFVFSISFARLVSSFRNSLLISFAYFSVGFFFCNCFFKCLEMFCEQSLFRYLLQIPFLNLRHVLSLV